MLGERCNRRLGSSKSPSPSAKEAGITVFNEIGVDPGIDHLYAMKTIDEVHAAGGKVLLLLWIL